ncbi:hypothetical protein PP7435_CHR1-0470 [Komagataella phaffii CBS 7435]|uniref:protein disulfide-isomerase n=2 Tax=Komagataella phaffii TaxID=460519 RepID=C4QWA2_KOMPG|nr:Protein disulfide isomerase, multifunctional protein resident in the endoplasmic reticulum lumen [Komagataella phaffii GS115]AOA61338.1 GQ67_02739T0 [Komagataella phaffii]CAH2446195.1 hypothetical protein BQ9382_C1-2435 [Komagataella phaffii CBS 7435]AOA66421.1 GQ68_02509T0 [Komagataella phaffii GS115]CAY67525.1 Protein disulfide isomerase, multifunctional protein resident in the endoplasmic reticulum lumen [Komagataella phaffii GS115]CCA36622.1 hypothetical protein PP7435_CHR1-0470 [Komaga
MKILSALLLLFTLAFAEVIELTNKNFDDVVLKSGKYTLVKFYADWCSHCKRMNPEYEKLAEELKPKSDLIQIAAIDANKYSKYMKVYDIDGFPTMKLFTPKDISHPIEFSGSRDSESFLNFLESTTGLKLKKKAEVNEPSLVQSIDDSTIDDLVGKDRFIAVTASWCGYCKRLHPEWEKLAKAFGNDDIVIGNVVTDVVEGENIKAKYKVQSFPTILYFTAGSDEPIRYESPDRTVEGLVKFVNEQAGLFRDPDGTLNFNAGLIPGVSDKLTNYIKEKDQSLLESTLDLLSNHEHIKDKFSVKYHKKVIEKLLKGENEFLNNEVERLSKMLNTKLSANNSDSVIKRLNILRNFIEAKTESKPQLLHQEL